MKPSVSRRLLALPALLVCILAGLHVSTAPANLPPLMPVAAVIDIQRYAGLWYVQGSIPVDIPFFSDADAYNYRETIALTGPAEAVLSCEFNNGAFDGDPTTISYKAFPEQDAGNAIWKIQPVWPVRFTYYVLHLEADYSTVIVGVPNRKWVWIMSRDRALADDKYNALLQIAADMGFDATRIRRIPHTI